MQTTQEMTEADLRRLGVQVAASGDLAELRRKTRITKNAMARMLGISIGALTAYEDATRALTAPVALRIGEWYWGAITALEDAIKCGIPVHKMLPLAQAAQHLGFSEEALESGIGPDGITIVRETLDKDGQPQRKTEHYRYESLGVLGIWLHAEDIPGPAARQIARKRARVKV